MSKIKDELLTIENFATKELEASESNKWGYPSKVCAICKGRGVVYVSDGQDDVVGEVCECQK